MSLDVTGILGGGHIQHVCIYYLYRMYILIHIQQWVTDPGGVLNFPPRALALLNGKFPPFNWNKSY